MLDEEEEGYLKSIKHPPRRLQWLASRLLIRRIMNPAGQILMEWDKRGKPHLLNYDSEITISHSGDYAAVLVSDRPGGVDIEERTNKINRISHKFIHDEEESLAASTEELIIVWSAKESLFKYKGGGGIDFRQHMRIKKIDRKSQLIHADYLKNTHEHYEINFQWIGDYLLTWLL